MIDLLKNEINELINCKKNCRSAPLNLYRLLLSSDEFNKHYLVALNEFEKLIPNIKKDTQIICKYYTKICSEKVNLKVIEKNIDFLKKTGNKFFGQKYYIKNESEAIKIRINANKYIEQFQNKKREDLISLLILEKYFNYSSQMNSNFVEEFLYK